MNYLKWTLNKNMTNNQMKKNIWTKLKYVSFK